MQTLSKTAGLFMLGLMSQFSHADADVLNLSWLDTSVAPQENFYAYANGHWQKQNPIPSHYATWSSFSVLWEQTQNNLHELLVNASEDKPAKVGSLVQKVGDFYFSGMDVAAIDKLGAKPLQAEFNHIEAIQKLDQLEKALAHLHLIGVRAFFDFSNMQDFQDSTQMIAAMIQDGLTLPDRDYYLKDDEKFKKIRAAFMQHMIALLQLNEETQEKAKADAEIVMRIETILARASKPQEELRDPQAIYHMMSVKDLNQMTPHFSWIRYLDGLGLADVKQLNVATPEFIRVMNEQLPVIALNDWKVYLRWRVLSTFAPYLSEAFVQESFHMQQALTGVESMLPRWKRVLSTENSILGFAIGELYVKKYASPEVKTQVLEIMHNIHRALEQDLTTLSWMAPDTRQAALKKLALMEERVGYPDQWWDYSSYQVDRGSYVLNVIRGHEFLARHYFSKIGKPIDRTDWAMTPQTFNAYYDPSMNNINIPMGILLPPFFDPKAPAAVNYGAIGVVIGHEITHGFDDQGAQFDGYGNLKNWWTAADLKKFKTATECIEKQYSQYKILGEFPVKGSLVVGEATADLGGVTLAYRAFLESKAYKNAKIIEGYTPEQQFFLGFAHVWANNIRPEQARLQVITDPHPPAMYRVNGTLANMPAFQKAFDIPDAFMSQQKCVIW